MNPRLDLLHPYPFQKLRELFAGIVPNPALQPINLSIGEPKHPTPQFIKDALVAGLGGLANYPVTQGSDALRQAMADWADRRYGVKLDPAAEVLPVNGSREALFAFAQASVDSSRHGRRVVISPNPFYQIYEGAALLAGARPFFLNTTPDNGFRMDWSRVPEDLWEQVNLVYVCSPGNPTGKVMTLADWREIFALSDQHGFVVCADECYSEIYFTEGEPPLGALTASQQLGRGFRNLVVFNSLSKRSNVPGLRSGLVAGDAELMKKFLLYRTYHGSAMSPAVQAASVAAWNDEAHVIENRRQYAAKFAAVMPILKPVLEFDAPDAAFYLWAKVPGGDDAAFARGLYEQRHVTVLPGSFLARDAAGANPGKGFVRIALVDGEAACIEAAQRIVDYLQ
ncbi:MAG: succinyldiaminopimelate transaminase [Hydrogenophilales bacterium 16-64-46]|nr:MAG: succinyldiaminopimelate transaminase [Hydrogenophilales bacterium 12-64-13]OYZ05714.1 MAG: succinyldiaminopimelate transaminase [Hydrogenophilales bacterium 16-64-46]OZA40250.1 MAG: succinyldiaminopimelate transaminase [Hydrogenophilales bacterium 17-64-34]HQT00801.1 succinyldiaminopimelate transaminase [Thiobacillus sp.]